MKCGTHRDEILSVSPVNSSWLGNHYAFEFFFFSSHASYCVGGAGETYTQRWLGLGDSLHR